MAMKPIGALVGNVDLDEGDAHGNDGNAKNAVADCSEHLKLATEAALLRGEETFCRHQIPETNLGDTRVTFHLRPRVLTVVRVMKQK